MNQLVQRILGCCEGPTNEDPLINVGKKKIARAALVKDISITDEGLIVLLELYKLELIPQVDQLYEVVKMASNNTKKAKKIEKLINEILAQVIDSKGFMYQITDLDKF